MNPPRAIIFDMDGVIVDSEPLHELAFREVFAEMGFDEARHGIDFKRYYGKSDRALWLDFIEMHSPPQPLEELLAWKQEHFLGILRKRQPIFPPIPDLVASLASRYPLAVASGSNHPVIDEVLSMEGLRRFFGIVVSVQDVARSKPFPDVFLRAAELLKVEPASCVVIEDSAAGVKAAHDAGMRVIAITNTLPASELSLANHLVRGYDEIERLLLG
jgi:HAD superfamily hydrolase (TIGR01509 family)